MLGLAPCGVSRSIMRRRLAAKVVRRSGGGITPIFPCALVKIVAKVVDGLDILDVPSAPMWTQDQLAYLLSQISGPAISKAAGVSLKTVYRLRDKKNAPNLKTIERLVDAAWAIKPEAVREAMKVSG